jgi:hypothetical protein
VVDVELLDDSLIGTKLPYGAQQICDPDRVQTIVPGARVTDSPLSADGIGGRQWRWEFQLLDGEDKTEMETAQRLSQNDLVSGSDIEQSTVQYKAVRLRICSYKYIYIYVTFVT